MMRGLSVFLLPDLLALLGDADDARRPALDSQSEAMSEDSESQPSQQPEGSPPRLVMARSTNSAAQTVVLVDRDHSMEAFVPAKVLEVLRAQLRYKSLARLRGSVLRLVKYQFVTRARCLASGQLEDSAAANWSASVSMATSNRRQQRLYLWIEELSVVDDNELVVDALPDVVEDDEVARLLGGQTDAELEARLTIRQKLPLLPAATNAAVSPTPRFDDGNPLTDMDCVIPEDQERELDEQDGWGPPPAAHSRPVPTDSQLIDENGHISMSEVQDASFASESGGQGLSALNEPELSASFPLEPTSLNVDGVATLLKQRSTARQDQPSGSETEDEYETRNNLDNDDSGPHQSPGSVDVPIDLMGDENENSAEYGSQALSRADYIYDDSELYTQPPDASTQEKSWFLSQEEKEANQDRRSQLGSKTQVVDDPQLFTQPPDTPGTQQLSRALETQIDDDARTNGNRVAETQLLNADDDTSAQSNEVQVSHEDGEDEDAQVDAAVDARDDISDHSRQDHEDQESRADVVSQRPNEQDEAHNSSEDASTNQPRGLGGFFRRLASNLGMVPSRDSTDRPSDPSSAGKETGDRAIGRKASEELGAQVAREGGPSITTAPDSAANVGSSNNSHSDDGDDENEDEQSQNPVAFVDEEVWQTQAPEVGNTSDNEHPPSSSVSSLAPDYGYEQDVDEDVEMATNSAVVAITSPSQSGVARVSVDASQVFDDEDHAQVSDSISVSTPSVAPLHQTPATMGKKRSLQEAVRDEAEADSTQCGTRHNSSSAAPTTRVSSASSPESPAGIGSERRNQSPHIQEQAGNGGVEEAKEDEPSSARKRRRLGRVLELPSPRRHLSTSTQTTDPSRTSNYAPRSVRMWARFRNADPSTSMRTHGSTTVRPSKRFEAFFPSLRMDRILQLIAEKKE